MTTEKHEGESLSGEKRPTAVAFCYRHIYWHGVCINADVPTEY